MLPSCSDVVEGCANSRRGQMTRTLAQHAWPGLGGVAPITPFGAMLTAARQAWDYAHKADTDRQAVGSLYYKA